MRKLNSPKQINLLSSFHFNDKPLKKHGSFLRNNDDDYEDFEEDLRDRRSQFRKFSNKRNSNNLRDEGNNCDNESNNRNSGNTKKGGFNDEKSPQKRYAGAELFADKNSDPSESKYDKNQQEKDNSNYMDPKDLDSKSQKELKSAVENLDETIQNTNQERNEDRSNKIREAIKLLESLMPE